VSTIDERENPPSIRHALDPIAGHLDLAGVNAGPDLDSERVHVPDGG
jgi:hypothetical protein